LSLLDAPPMCRDAPPMCHDCRHHVRKPSASMTQATLGPWGSPIGDSGLARGGQPRAADHFPRDPTTASPCARIPDYYAIVAMAAAAAKWC
jgi:hypothetical protein